MGTRLAVILLLGTAFVDGCAPVPITGRSQLSLVSDAQITAVANQSFSKLITAADKSKRLMKADESPQARAALASVQRVSDRIIDAAGLRGKYNWQTVVIKAREPNAFVMPNGKIVVFTGLLPVAKNEAGLAAVIGHEVAHVVARHGAERVSQVLLAKTTLNAIDATLAQRNSKHQASVAAALGYGAQFGVLLPFSREHESEADRIGLLYMAKAGYDPSDAIGLWERMEVKGGKGPWEFMSSHPSPETRRAQIRQWLPEANLYYADRRKALPANLTELQAARLANASKSALAPVATLPVYEPGFWYRSKARNASAPITYTYAENKACGSDECLLIKSDKGHTGTYTKDFALAETKDPNGAVTTFSPPLRVIRWPLQVGDSWSEVLTISRVGQASRTLPVKASVLGYEEVAVPAGEFMAYKIVVSLNGIRFREIWYAPETRTFVKTISYNAQGGESVSELVDYKKAEGLQASSQ